MPEQRSTSRAVFIILIAGAVLYFIIGGVVAWIGWFPLYVYALTGGVVGSLASTVGLISLTRPGLSQTDLDNIEIQSLRKITDTSQEIKALEEARAVTEEQIDSLEEQKQQMEFLVQKASLSLFLKEQRRLYERRIQDELSKSKELVSNLAELATIDKKLEALNEEIDNDPNVALLKTIIASAQSAPEDVELGFADLPPITRFVLLVGREVAKSIEKLVKITVP